MTVVFVHGVPETGAIWDGVRAHLGDGTRTVALDLPGFGTPRPEGFCATKDEYAAWLADAVRGAGGPVDVVGHDWGSGIVLRMVTAFDVPVRSWVVESASVFHPDYVWHDLARTWQTPGRGEEWMTAFLAGGRDGPGFLRSVIRAACANEADAAALEERQDETMGRCILDLYRSAQPNAFADWGSELSSPTRSRGLVLRATADPFDDPGASAEVAARLGARTDRLEGLGHWWMLEDPAASAAVLRSFWASLDS